LLSFALRYRLLALQPTCNAPSSTPSPHWHDVHLPTNTCHTLFSTHLLVHGFCRDLFVRARALESFQIILLSHMKSALAAMIQIGHSASSSRKTSLRNLIATCAFYMQLICSSVSKRAPPYHHMPSSRTDGRVRRLRIKNSRIAKRSHNANLGSRR
jgi:hypothetical protein